MRIARAAAAFFVPAQTGCREIAGYWREKVGASGDPRTDAILSDARQGAGRLLRAMAFGIENRRGLDQDQTIFPARVQNCRIGAPWGERDPRTIEVGPSRAGRPTRRLPCSSEMIRLPAGRREMDDPLSIDGRE